MALVATLLSACFAWSTFAATPSLEVRESARRVATALDDCFVQGDKSFWGAIQCGRAQRFFTSRLRHFFEHGETWQYPELLATLKGASELDWNSEQLVQIREIQPPAKNQHRFFVVRLQHISLAMVCDAAGRGCLLDSFEWPFTYAELYCTSPLKVMKDFHVAILRNPALARVAEQIFEQPDARSLNKSLEISDGEPARTPVTRQIDLVGRRAHYAAADFQLEVELMDPLDTAHPVEGQLKSFAIYGSPVPLSCQWRD